MLAFSLFSVFASLASAASSVELAGVEAHFQNAGLGSLFPSFAPQAVLDASFSGAEVDIGKPVTQDTAGTRPELLVDGGEGFDASGTFSLFLVDANIVGTSPTGASQNLHWLTNGVTLAGGSATTPSGVVYDAQSEIRSYAGPGPVSGSGAHRYLLLLYREPATFTAPEGFSAPINDVIPFDLTAYVSAAGLELVAANYFTVENGVATVSVEETAAVDSATLAAPSSSASASAPTSSGSASSPASSGSASGSGSASASAGSSASSGSAAASSSSPAASASAQAESGAGMLAPSAFAIVAGALVALF